MESVLTAKNFHALRGNKILNPLGWTWPLMKPIRQILVWGIRPIILWEKILKRGFRKALDDCAALAIRLRYIGYPLVGYRPLNIQYPNLDPQQVVVELDDVEISDTEEESSEHEEGSDLENQEEEEEEEEENSNEEDEFWFLF